MTQPDQEQPTTESIAAMGRSSQDDGRQTATTTADDRPEIRHDDGLGTQEAFDDGQSHAGPAATSDADGTGYASSADSRADATGAGGGTYGGTDVHGDGYGSADTAQAPTEAAPGTARPDSSDVTLMPEEHAERMRQQWQSVQATFVDDPRGAVTQADTLVAEVMQTLAARFADHKRGLEESWQRGEQAGTEDLRVALQSYRAYFDRLLHT
jgi:hypothetical protein